MMLVSPGIFNSFNSHSVDIAADDHVDFWYDSMNDCYQNNMRIDIICGYVEAINDEDYE